MKFVKALATISEAGLLLSVMERMRVEVRIPWVKFARENIFISLFSLLSGVCLSPCLSISFVVIHHYLSFFFLLLHTDITQSGTDEAAPL